MRCFRTSSAAFGLGSAAQVSHCIVHCLTSSYLSFLRLICSVWSQVRHFAPRSSNPCAFPSAFRVRHAHSTRRSQLSINSHHHADCLLPRSSRFLQTAGCSASAKQRTFPSQRRLRGRAVSILRACLAVLSRMTAFSHVSHVNSACGLYGFDETCLFCVVRVVIAVIAACTCKAR